MRRQAPPRPTSSVRFLLFALVLASGAACSPRAAGDGASNGYAPDRERAARFASRELIRKVRNGYPVPHWLDGQDRFWLAVQTAKGHEYVVVDAATGGQSPAFDHAAMARALSSARGKPVPADSLPILGLRLAGERVVAQLADRTWRCDLARARCDSTGPIWSHAEVPSPDGRTVAFVRDHNVWLRDEAGRERQLTTGGVEYFAYGNAKIFDMGRVIRRRTGMPREVMGLVWSPDGRYLASIRTDRRAVPLRPHFTEHLPPDGAPRVHLDRQPVAADNILPGSRVELIDVRSGAIVTADVPSEKLQDFSPVHFAAGSVWWNLAGNELFFDGGTRDARTYYLFAVDMRTGRSRTVIEETEEHYYDFNPDDYASPNFSVTTDGAEAIWYSQRTGYGHLYRYDARTGKLANPITQGEWVVTDLLRVDEAARLVYFVAVGREPGRNPYFRHLYRVSLDGGEPELLTPEDADHGFAAPPTLSPAGLGGPASSLSPSGRFFADTYSTLEEPPVLVVRTAAGDSVATVLRADASELFAAGWRPPTRFVVKAADGKTDLWGVMYTPFDMDSSAKYAVVEQTYPGPQGSFGTHGFMSGVGGFLTTNLQQMAELGFVGVALDGRGTSRRGRGFRYAFAGTEDVFGSADHRAAIENLAKRYPFVDAERVGISGGSFGGYGTVHAMLLNPGFFDVVVSHVGPHDFRKVGPGYTVDRFFGIPSEPGDEDDFYATISNTRLADRLEGKLLLIYGEIDENVPFWNAITFLDALIKADKDFDLIVLPNTPHGTSGHPYARRRQMDYFVEHLGGPRRN